MKQSFDYAKLVVEPRFVALQERLGGKRGDALDCLCSFWNAALEYWKKGKQYVPEKVFRLSATWPLLIEVDLAEAKPNGIYAKGAEEAFGWLLDLQMAKHAGGIASAEARKKKYGTAQPKSSNSVEQTAELSSGCSAEQTPNNSEDHRTEPNASTSISTSISEEERDTPKSSPEDEALAQAWYEMAKRHSTTVRYSAKWPQAVRQLREIDKISLEDLQKLLVFVEQDSFWRDNALSLPALRVRSKANHRLKVENALASMRKPQGPPPPPPKPKSRMLTAEDLHKW